MIKEELKKKCINVDVQNLSDIKKDKTININSKKDVYKFYENISLEKLLKIYIDYYGVNSLSDLVNYCYRKNKENKKGVLKMQEVKEKLKRLEEVLKEINSELDFNTYDFIPKFNSVFKSDVDLNQLEKEVRKAKIKAEKQEELKQVFKDLDVINKKLINISCIYEKGNISDIIDKNYNYDLPSIDDLYFIIRDIKMNIKKEILEEGLIHKN